MGRPERPLDNVDEPVIAFARDLRALRKAAGNPSYRELARTAMFAPSVLSSAASGRRMPTLAVTLAFVAACGGDQRAWEGRWRSITAHTGIGGERDRFLSHSLPGYARPAQLPTDSMTFVGRTQHLADTVRLITQTDRSSAPLMINGFIGVGKTAFALRLADEVAACFPDGQLYADLGGTGTEISAYHSAHIAYGFLRALGVRETLIPDEPMQRLGLYRSLLAQRRVVVLLEDARDETQVRPLLGRATQSLVVVTSRARLLGLDSMHRIDLGTFTRDESMALLGQVIGVKRVEAEFAAADALADLCGDLPMAVNVIGRVIAARPGWAIARAVDQFVDNDHLLDSLAIGDVSLRARFDAAYRRLPLTSRRALGHMSSTGSRWTTAIGLAETMGIPLRAAERTLETLVDVGLLTRANLVGRYCVPVMVRVFAAGAHREAALLNLTQAS